MKARHSASLKVTQDPDPAVLEQAADWLVRRRAGFRPGDEERFHAWISAEPQSGAVLAELEKAWNTISYPGRCGHEELAYRRLLALRRTCRRRSILAAGCIGLAAAAALMIGVSPSFSLRTGSAPQAATVTVRPDRQLLPDGSTVERNARTDIEIEYTRQERRLRLLRGEAFFSVASDPSRPFVVVAGGVETRAVGTEFSVRFAPAAVDVMVIEGEVAVSNIASAMQDARGTVESSSSPVPMEPVYVAAGKRVVMSADVPRLITPEIKVMKTEEISAALAWRGKRIEFTRTPLSQVVEIFNRQNTLQLSIGDPVTRDLRITGVFWTDDPEGLVRLLESGFEITAERSDARISLAQY